MEAHGLAIADATAALEVDPRNVKAYYRIGSAYMGLGKWKNARNNYRKACQLKPSDRDAALRLKECEKEVRREAFEKVTMATLPGSQPWSEGRGGGGMGASRPAVGRGGWMGCPR